MVADHQHLAYRVAAKFFLPGADDEDVRQEALCGLLIGVRTFNPARGVTLSAYLAFAVRMHLVSKVKQANRQQSQPLNTAERWVRDEHGRLSYAVDQAEDADADPALIVERKETFAEFTDAMMALTAKRRGHLILAYNHPSYRHLDTRRRLETSVWTTRKQLRRALRAAA